MDRDEVIALVRAIGGPDRADPLCPQGDMITLDVDEVVRLVNIAAAHQAEQATQLNQSLGLYEQARVPLTDSMSRHSRAMLLNVLWHHQGASSAVGQPLRGMLGIGRFDNLSDEQLSEAKWIDALLSKAVREPERVPIHMERVDKSTSQHWWNEQAGIRMPSPELYTRGDTVLCWVNEGELLAYLSGITGDAK